MFPSAVTALTGARRSRSPERAGRERARLGERETEGARGARGERASGGRRRSAQWPAWGRGRAASARVRGRGGVRARGHGSGPEAASRRGGRGGRTGRARGGGGARPRGPGALCGAGDPRRREGNTTVKGMFLNQLELLKGQLCAQSVQTQIKYVWKMLIWYFLPSWCHALIASFPKDSSWA